MGDIRGRNNQHDVEDAAETQEPHVALPSQNDVGQSTNNSAAPAIVPERAPDLVSFECCGLIINVLLLVPTLFLVSLIITSAATDAFPWKPRSVPFGLAVVSLLLPCLVYCHAGCTMRKIHYQEQGEYDSTEPVPLLAAAAAATTRHVACPLDENGQVEQAGGGYDMS